jgi:hypothetical protein
LVQTLNYREYSIRTYMPGPGKWLAEIRRLDGKNINVLFPPGERAAVTISPAQYTEQAAIDSAKAAIDDGRMK